jgi:hypothetical protein
VPAPIAEESHLFFFNSKERVMAETGFPSLNATPDDECYAIDQLGTHPERWGVAPIPELKHAVAYYAMAWAWNACSEELAQPLGSLFALFTERVPERDRLETLQVVGLYAERAARDDGLRHAGSACVWFLKDPSSLVVSTAALSLASLMPSTEDDGMAGPRFVMRWADQCGNGERRAAMLAGLVALGNPDVMALVGDCWRSLDAAGREVLAHLGVGQVPAACNVDFFLRWAESAVRAADQEAEGLVPAMGAVLTAGRRAAMIGTHGQPLGVVEGDRAFPAWSRPFESVITLTRRWTKEEYAEAIAPRLIDIARRECAPRVTPAALHAWGVPDVPHVEAVAKAVAAQAAAGAELTVFEAPVEIDVHPDPWQPNQLVEWGILNPNGPTKCQITVVDLGSGLSALVWTLHHFLLPKCLVLAAGRFDEPDLLREAVSRSFVANGPAGHPLIIVPPHWVRLFPCNPLDADAMALLFGAAHHQQILADDMRGAHPDQVLAQMRGLAVDPVAEICEQEREAWKELGPLVYAVKTEDWETFSVFEAEIRKRDTLTELPGDDFYLEWMRLAAEPAFVDRVSACFDGAELEARRRYNQGRAQPQASGADGARP